MLTSFQRKHVLLFIIAIVLPSSLLVILSWRMLDQQAELDEKRLVESRARCAADITREMRAKLEQIKLQEVSVAAHRRTTQERDYSHRDVVFVGLTDRERLLLPWEMNTTDKFNMAMRKLDYKPV